MNHDQLDDVGWTPDQWTALNDQARQVVTDQAKLRPLIPAGPEMPNAYVVQTPPLGGAPLEFDTEAPTLPVVRLRIKFVVRAEQLHDTALIGRLVDRAGRRLAAAEDAVLMYGGLAVLGADVDARGLRIETPGLATYGGAIVTPVGGGPFAALDGLVAAARDLRKRGWHGPFNAALDVDYWNALAMTFPGRNTDGFRRAARILGSEQDSRFGLAPPGLGSEDPLAVVFEPSASIVELATVHPPRLSHVEMKDGDVILRIEEAFLLRLFDPEGVQTVTSCVRSLLTCEELAKQELAAKATAETMQGLAMLLQEDG